MNNNIQEDYCSFEISKLLKEKGFDGKLYTFYDENGLLKTHEVELTKKINELRTHLGADTINDFKAHIVIMDNSLNEVILAPTHALAIKWIRENFGIWVELLFDIRWLKKGKICFQWRIYDNSEEWCTSIIEYKTPEEATEVALLYTLKNLI